MSVDEPDLPRLLRPTSEVTGDFGYVRFHGRNAAKWWTGDNASRYDYLYNQGELGEWVDRIKDNPRAGARAPAVSSTTTGEAARRRTRGR